MANFLHGIETVTKEVAGRSYQIVRSGVIGLIGIAPSGPKNALVLCVSDNDFAQFGSPLSGFTIPQALEVISNQGAATVMVVNVFDPDIHTSNVVDEVKIVTDGKLKLGASPIGSVTIKNNDGTPTSYIEGTDYTLDEYGNFIVKGNLIANGAVIKFSYKKLNAAAINAATLIGTKNDTTGVRTGSKCFQYAFNDFGFTPKIMIAPGFSTMTGVGTLLQTLANKYRGIFYIDAPAGISVNTVIVGRGPVGTIGFNISDRRGELLYPQLLRYDQATDSKVAFPYSAFLAGIRQAVDNNSEGGGFWVSSSNKQIICEGVETAISGSINDDTADNQILNAAGITTVLNTYGTGIRTFGNRSSAYPSEHSPKTFVNMQRIDDIISESMEMASLPYLDQPVTQAFIDTVREEGNAFIRTLIQRGALLNGSRVVYNRDDNSPTDLADGRVTFERIYMGPTPAERITFKSVMDINLLAQFK